jgi:hypothetical protein
VAGVVEHLADLGAPGTAGFDVEDGEWVIGHDGYGVLSLGLSWE